MKYPHPKKSLKDLTYIEIKKPIHRKANVSTQKKLRLQPWAPGCLQVFPGDSLAPIKLVINNNPEFFL